MKRLMLVLCALPLAMSLYAQEVSVPTTIVNSPSAISWVSKDTTDVVTINNGTGSPINVTITVMSDTAKKLSGINIVNCGQTTHVDAGSSAICGSSDSNNPVKFNSDSPTDPASGTYEIKPKT